MPTKEEIMAQIQIFKNAKGSLVQDSLVKILEMLCNGDTGNDYVLTSQDKTDIANIVLQLFASSTSTDEELVPETP